MRKRYQFLLLLACMWLLSCRQNVVHIDGLPCQTDSAGAWSLVDTKGHLLLPPHTFERQPSAVVNGMFSLPDAEGFYHLYAIEHPTHPASQRRFANIGHFFEATTWAQESLDAPLLLIDRRGETVASTLQYPQYEIILAHNFCDGRALIATREGTYGYMDPQGRIVIPPLYDRAYDFREGLALVGTTNPKGETGYQLIDPDGRVRLAIQLDNSLLGDRFGDGLLPFKNLHTGECCYLDWEGTTRIRLPREVKEAYRFEQGMAVFQTASGTGMIDKEGKSLVEARYEDAFVAGKGRTGLKQKGQWALAEADGSLLTPFRYDTLSRYYDSGLAVARQEGRYLFVDRQGAATGEERFTRIVEDPTARRELPQCFFRNLPGTDRTANNLTTDPAPHSPTAITPSTRPQEAPLTATAIPSRSTIRSNNWKEISRQNPFYQEASKLLSGRLEEKDANSRRMILNYVEHLRTSYTTKDIDFLEQLFSENALIIVGTVVRTSPEAESGYLPAEQVVYNVKSKRQYLERLKQVFRANRSIRVEFSGFHIMRHPTQPGIYGVSLRQRYESDLYSDDGYLFLLWDFRDETAPKIHVRTWQPCQQEDHTPLPEEAIFGIQNFNLQ